MNEMEGASELEARFCQRPSEPPPTLVRKCPASRECPCPGAIADTCPGSPTSGALGSASPREGLEARGRRQRGPAECPPASAGRRQARLGLLPLSLGAAVWLWEPTLSENPGPPLPPLRFLLGFIRTEEFRPHSWVQIPNVPRSPGTSFSPKGKLRQGAVRPGARMWRPALGLSSGSVTLSEPLGPSWLILP